MCSHQTCQQNAILSLWNIFNRCLTKANFSWRQMEGATLYGSLRRWALFKVRGPFVETFWIEKDSYILTPFNVKIASNYAFLFLDKENKILLGPPPQKKAQGYERSRYGYTDNSYKYTQCTGGLSGMAQCVYSQLQVFTRSRWCDLLL